LQITNPHRFHYYPNAVLSPGLASTRPWLRQMNSRLVVVQDFSNQLRLDRFFQMGVPRVIISGRRSGSAARAHAQVRDLLGTNASIALPHLEDAPPGVHVFAYRDYVELDPGHIAQSLDEEEFEL
jgi:hypothetical protein